MPELRQRPCLSACRTQRVWCIGQYLQQDSVRQGDAHFSLKKHHTSYRRCESERYQGCFMISGTVMRLRGSTTKMRFSRSQTSPDRASLLSRMKGDSFQVLFTSCSLHAWRKRPHDTPPKMMTYCFHSIGKWWNAGCRARMFGDCPRA